MDEPRSTDATQVHHLQVNLTRNVRVVPGMNNVQYKLMYMLHLNDILDGVSCSLSSDILDSSSAACPTVPVATPKSPAGGTTSSTPSHPSSSYVPAGPGTYVNANTGSVTSIGSSNYVNPFANWAG